MTFGVRGVTEVRGLQVENGLPGHPSSSCAEREVLLDLLQCPPREHWNQSPGSWVVENGLSWTWTCQYLPLYSQNLVFDSQFSPSKRPRRFVFEFQQPQETPKTLTYL